MQAGLRGGADAGNVPEHSGAQQGGASCDEDAMAITLTEKAAQHVQKYLSRRGKGIGLRLGVRTTGCSGLAYKLEYVDELSAEDQVFESNGVKVIVDPKSLAYIDGTELDFAREGLNEGFKFNNPNVKDECGCGESFRV
ncbi:iron-sulfur cluster assembly protein [Paraburkholderia kururiensis]